MLHIYKLINKQLRVCKFSLYITVRDINVSND